MFNSATDISENFRSRKMKADVELGYALAIRSEEDSTSAHGKSLRLKCVSLQSTASMAVCKTFVKVCT